MASSPITSRHIHWEMMETVIDFILPGAPKSQWMVTVAMKLKHAPRKKSYNKPRQSTKKQRHYSPTKVPIVKATVFPVVMYGCKSWTVKKVECWKIDAFEPSCWRRPLRVPWTARRSNESILKEISGEYSLEGLMLKLKFPILWPPDVKCWLNGKDPDAGKDRKQEEKGTTEDKIVGWHHQLNDHEFEQTLGDGEGQRSLACCSPLCHTKSNMTERLNSNNHEDMKFALMGSSLLGEMGE